jgi:hypothetical protein
MQSQADTPNHNGFLGLISMVKSATGTVTWDVNPVTIMDQIRKGEWKPQVERIRHLYREAFAIGKDGKNAVKHLKEKLPGVLWNGRFGKRNNDGLISHSGLFCADLDNLDGKLENVRAKLSSCPHLVTQFVSPTGTGLKAVFRVVPEEPQRAKFRAVEEQVLQITGERIDPQCCDLARLCFVSFDPHLTINHEASELVCTNFQLCSTDAQTHRLIDSQTYRHVDIQDSQVEGDSAPSWVLEFLPSAVHETNALFFLMGRRALDIEKTNQRRLTTQQLKLAFNLWFDRSRPEFLSQTREEYFVEFCRIRSYVKKGLNEEDPVQTAWRLAKIRPLPPEAMDFEDPKIRQLIALCFQLQSQAGRGTFFLSSHSAASLLEKEPAQVWRWLHALEGAGTILCVKRGDPKLRLATEYRYAGAC